MKHLEYALLIAMVSMSAGCGSGVPEGPTQPPDDTAPSPEAAGRDPAAAGDSSAATFGEEVAFLRAHTPLVVLSNAAGAARVAVAPAYQGRVMTSTADGDGGLSFGWINRELIASGQLQPHINVFGGEDRFWIGPEGGQFSVFFARDVPFDLEHWFTPPSLDTEPFELVEQQEDLAVFQREMQLTNYSGTVFDLRVDREVRLLTRDETVKVLGIQPAAEVRWVAFESVNTITNTGRHPWDRDTGLLSIWILGILNPSPDTTVVVPYTEGAEEDLGPIVNDAYFGRVPSDRLAAAKGTIYFRGDGKYRSKIGLSPERSRPVLGSYDAAHGVLTVVQYNKPPDAVDYVNSMWELQKQPYRGDVVNAYNDGPAAPGAEPLGPFYEIESSSPAAALAPGESLTHVHRTIHLQGTAGDLSPLAAAVLGVTVDQIENGLPR